MTLARSLLFVAAAASLAHAQASPAAEALFREGRALVKAGNLDAGCAKLEASERIESSVGTLLNVGDCNEKLGKTARAWAAFRKAEAMAKRAGDDPKRQAEAQRRALRLEPGLSNVVVKVGTSTPGLVVKQDGDALDPAALGGPLPVDPGVHVIVAEAPGRTPFTTRIAVGKGRTRYVVIPTLERPSPVAPPAPVTSAPPVVVHELPAAAPAVPPRRDEPSMWTAPRQAAIGLGLAGAATIGVGVYFGMRADDLQSQSDARCPSTICNDSEGLRLNDDARDKARTANILFAAGGAAIATATVMWLVGAPEQRATVTPTIDSDHIGASMVGRF